MNFMEFLEIIARIATQLFSETESEDLELANKIEFLLDDILP